MSSDVVLSSAMRSNLLSLQNTQSLIDKTQLKLATGLKVNSALDNPQSFFQAQSLNNRASDLGRLLDGLGQSIRTIEAADAGISALTRLINQADSVANEAQSEILAAEGFARIRGNVDLSGVQDLTDIQGGGVIDDGDTFSITIVRDGATGTGDVDKVATVNITINDGDTVDDIAAQINSAVAPTTAAAGSIDVNDYLHASVTSSGQLLIESKEEGLQIRVQDSQVTGTPSTNLGAAGFAALGLDSFVGTEDGAVGTGTSANRQAGTIVAGRVLSTKELDGDAATASASYYDSTNEVFLASGLISEAGLTNITISSSTTADLTISIDGIEAGAIELNNTSTFQSVIDGINNDATLKDAGVTASFDAETGQINITVGDEVGQLEVQFDNVQGTLTSAFGFGAFAADATITSSTTAASELFTFVGTSANLDQYESDYNNLLAQIDDLVGDASYRGVNLLQGDNLTTFFNEDRSSRLVTEGRDFTSLGLGINEGSFVDVDSIGVAINEISNALETVRAFGTSIANDLSIIQTRQDFTNSTINTLQAGADDLTVADQNEEGANLLALQTRQTLGVTSLSLASQSQQSVLRLF